MKKYVFFALMGLWFNTWAQQADFTPAIQLKDVENKGNAALVATGGTALTASNISAAGGAGIYISYGHISGIISYNWGGNITKNKNADSVQLSTLIFPDISSSSFLLKMNYLIGSPGKEDAHYYITGNFAYQLLNITKDSTLIEGSNSVTVSHDYSFDIINAGGGVKCIIPVITNSEGNGNSLSLEASLMYAGFWVLPSTNESFDQYYYNSVTQKSIAKNIGGFTGEVGCFLNNSYLYIKCFYSPFSNISSFPDKLIFSVGIQTFMKTKL